MSRVGRAQRALMRIRFSTQAVWQRDAKTFMRPDGGTRCARPTLRLVTATPAERCP